MLVIKHSNRPPTTQICHQHRRDCYKNVEKVGNREDSNVYIRMKMRGAQEIGMNAEHVRLPSSITEDELIAKISSLNNDPAIHGIILQLPLDSGSDFSMDHFSGALHLEELS